MSRYGNSRYTPARVTHAPKARTNVDKLTDLQLFLYSCRDEIFAKVTLESLAKYGCSEKLTARALEVAQAFRGAKS